MLTPQNIEAGLSYAYLHAVASRAGFGCEYTTRHMDFASIDAVVREDGQFLATDSILGTFEAPARQDSLTRPRAISLLTARARSVSFRPSSHLFIRIESGIPAGG